MARVFITGSADGLGLMVGELLASQGHSVVLHARNEVRARDARAALQRAAAVVVGDLPTLAARDCLEPGGPCSHWPGRAQGKRNGSEPHGFPVLFSPQVRDGLWVEIPDWSASRRTLRRSAADSSSLSELVSRYARSHVIGKVGPKPHLIVHDFTPRQLRDLVLIEWPRRCRADAKSASCK